MFYIKEEKRSNKKYIPQTFYTLLLLFGRVMDNLFSKGA